MSSSKKKELDESSVIMASMNKFKKQNYRKLKASCENEKRLFVDDLFLPNESSIYKSRRLHGIQWKRPHDIAKDPKLFVDAASSKDVNQGQLGNCWFVAALAVLASEKKFLYKVIPDAAGQTFNKTQSYAGIFRFQFWQFGQWIEVVIDDLLPTLNGQLLFTHSSEKNEFWSSLIEKAYAKLNGCYEHLDGGNLSEALQDFTGGVCETIPLDKDLNKYENLFEAMKKAYERSALMACAINVNSRREIESKMANGLVRGHAYGITKVVNMHIKGNSSFSFLGFNKEKLQMIRMKNPWGKTEWLGPWSDNSPEWKNVPKGERERMGMNFDDDGEFWMEFGDFMRNFNEVSICRIINTSVLSIRKTWNENYSFGSWLIASDRAGGCINNRATFCFNPQYLFEINSSSESKSTEMLISLDQMSRRFLGKENLTIGFFIMKVEENRRYRLHKAKPKTAASEYSNSRSVFMREHMKNGRYVIIPSTFEPNHDGRFLLRIYTDDNNNLTLLKKDWPKPSRCNPFSKYATCVTSLIVKTGMDLVNPQAKYEFDTYVRIKCEKEIVQSKLVKGSMRPEWNVGAIFFRYDQKKPIKIEVWIKRPFSDELYGFVLLDAEPNNKHFLLECNLTGFEITKGRLEMEVQSMTNINDL